MPDLAFKPKSPAVVLRLSRDHYGRLEAEAARRTENEGRSVTVTEVVRRIVLESDLLKAA